MYDHYKDLKAKYPSAKLSIVGHSLGAAMATHAVVYFWSKNIKVDTFYTFGSPRIGDELFFQWFTKKVFPGFKARITHG